MRYHATFITADGLKAKEIITGPEVYPHLVLHRTIVPFETKAIEDMTVIRPNRVRVYELESLCGFNVVYREAYNAPDSKQGTKPDSSD